MVAAEIALPRPGVPQALRHRSRTIAGRDTLIVGTIANHAAIIGQNAIDSIGRTIDGMLSYLGSVTHGDSTAELELAQG